MKLSEFVKETINSVVSGVVLSQKDLEKTNAIINPSTIDENGFISLNYGNKRVINISFDVAVTVDNIEGDEAGIKVSVANFFSGKVGGETKTANQKVSRVSFEIPVLLPINDDLTEQGIKEKQKNLEIIKSLM
jgi:hypothetical protein|nr:MAG TPA: hypothetical protein [Caudoviricetes sp.]DAI03503.1 MAG TPA: hypothetical protein [Caudoviricetes sp.]DAJ56882.1 MAG TPA: hypothetical protein [Caudoviricetes sp.]